MLNPATHPLADANAALQEQRSTKAGMLNPATPPARSRACSWRRPLNEGRDVKPGDTRCSHGEVRAAVERSTKAGMLNPATRASRVVGAAQLSFAQRRPGC